MVGSLNNFQTSAVGISLAAGDEIFHGADNEKHFIQIQIHGKIVESFTCWHITNKMSA